MKSFMRDAMAVLLVMGCAAVVPAQTSQGRIQGTTGGMAHGANIAVIDSVPCGARFDLQFRHVCSGGLNLASSRRP